MATRRLLAALGTLGVVVLAGCTHGQSPQTQKPAPSRQPTSVTQFDCADHIPGQAPPRSYRVILGAVALPVWPAGGVQQTATDGANDAPRLFAKSGLMVRVGVASTITVQAPAHRVARIGWRNSSVTPTRSVQIPACTSEGSARWLAFPGGFWVDRPTCVRVTVRTATAAATERVAVGARCP